MNSTPSKLRQHLAAGTLTRLKASTSKVFMVICALIDDGKDIRRAEVMRISGVSRNTYFAAMRELESADLIVRRRRGRR